MKLLALALIFLSSQAFAALNPVHVPIYVCADVGTYSEKTGVEYSKVSPTIMVHDACAQSVYSQGVVTDVTFNKYGAELLTLTIGQPSHPEEWMGELNISFDSVEQAQIAKDQIIAGKFSMLVINPKKQDGYDLDHAKKNMPVMLFDRFMINPDQLLGVRTGGSHVTIRRMAPKKSPHPSWVNGVIQAMKSDL